MNAPLKTFTIDSSHIPPIKAQIIQGNTKITYSYDSANEQYNVTTTFEGRGIQRSTTPQRAAVENFIMYLEDTSYEAPELTPQQRGELAYNLKCFLHRCTSIELKGSDKIAQTSGETLISSVPPVPDNRPIKTNSRYT
ncbi:MAG: hypothetical protein KDD76_00145 [Rickettsiales bacterium]|nr:hypothetical protein [Rickettsiales bacterium]